MILSMTGFGAAELNEAASCYAVEVRSLNHRYLKLSLKLPDYLQFAEPTVEKLLRQRLARGSVTCTVRFRSDNGDEQAALNTTVLQSYLDQMAGVRLPDGVAATVDLGVVATLPGVCQGPDTDEEAKKRRLGAIEKATALAIDALLDMRQNEGLALRSDMMASCEKVRTHLAAIAARTPVVVDEYHDRLRTRVGNLMQKGGFELEAEGLMREVAIYAERCDISEEVTRLGVHLDQFAELCDRSEPVGRTLDFLSQELLREANTIASKSNDAEIARSVVEIKGLIDRLKEQVQNVE